MKTEKLFDCITDIKEEFIEEAENDKIPKRKNAVWKIAGAAAACFVSVAVLGIIGRLLLPGASAGGGTNREPGENYMSYAGPAFPLTALESTEGLIFERSINFDFSPYHNLKNEALIRDNYTVTNVTDEEIKFTAVYPFVGNISTPLSRIPKITVDGKQIETKLAIGPYSGGFASAWGDDSETEKLNLSSLESWEEYKILLENGEYIKNAFAENPEMNQQVKVYSFKIEYNVPMSEFDEIDNPDMIVSFDYDEEKSNVFFYGFNAMSWNSKEGWVKAGSYIPRSFSPDFENHPIYVIITGEDIESISVKTVAGKSKGSWDEREETDSFSITTEKYDAVLSDVVFDIISSYDAKKYYGADYEESIRDVIGNEEYLGYVAEFMYEYGQLSEDPAERYGRGRLDDVIIEAGYVSRVLYAAFEVTVPAGKSVDIGTLTLREASYDYYGARESQDMEGFDMVTRLGTNLDIVKQSASVSNTEGIEIAYNNFGFDIENNITEVVLGSEEHYYLEIIKK